MLWNRLSRGAGLWACVALISAGLATAQDTHQVPGLEKGRIYPPPTFFAPPSRATNGAIIVNPAHMPPGVPMPQVIWQNGDQQHEVVKPSDHWLGLQCGKIGPALRAQLGLDENQGVLVEAIVDESPAAKAGLEKYDVLVQAGDRTLSKVQDLIDEVDAVKDGKLAVELIRKGKKETVEVTPEKRPPMEAPGTETADDSSGEWNDFLEHMRQWEPGKDGRPSMKFRFWRQPGTILPGQPKSTDKLPGNVKIQIRKQGDKPAEIEVTRDDETWKVNETELDKLPDDLRPHVERMLGKPKGPAPWQVFPSEGIKVPNPLEGHEGMIEKRFEELNRRIENLPNPLEGREGMIEERFEQMNRRFDQLRESLDELREKRREKPKPEKKSEPETDSPKLRPSSTET
jgi:PDZ domain-containing protein